MRKLKVGREYKIAFPSDEGLENGFSGKATLVSDIPSDFGEGGKVDLHWMFKLDDGVVSWFPRSSIVNIVR